MSRSFKAVDTLCLVLHCAVLNYSYYCYYCRGLAAYHDQQPVHSQHVREGGSNGGLNIPVVKAKEERATDDDEA